MSALLDKLFADKSIVSETTIGKVNGVPFTSAFVFSHTRINGEPETLVYLYAHLPSWKRPGRLVASLGYTTDAEARDALGQMLWGSQ
jgi:hypothetical protein